MNTFQALAHRAASPRWRRALAAGLWLAACGPALAVTLDNFSDGIATLETPAMSTGPDGWLRADTAASVPGGWRSLALQPQPGSTSLAFISLDPQGLQAYRTPSQQLYVSFGYGQTTPMNLNLSGQAALRLDVAWAGARLPASSWNDNGLALTVYATTSTGAGLNPNGSAAQTVLRSGTLDLPFAAFATNASTGVGVDWADVDGLLFVVNEAIVGADVAGFGIRSLSTVSAVPEPASWALSAAGLAALALRRRRVRRRSAAAAAAAATATALACGAAGASDVINISGAGASGAGANIFSYPVAPGTLVDLFNPVLVALPAGTYELKDAWGLPGAVYDTWNFELSAPGSWASHYVAAEVLAGGGYRLLVDGISLLDPACTNHFCAWDTRAQATAAFLATPAYSFTLTAPAVVAFAAADYYLADNLGGMSLLLTQVPEPPAAALLAAGLGLVLVIRRRGWAG